MKLSSVVLPPMKLSSVVLPPRGRWRYVHPSVHPCLRLSVLALTLCLLVYVCCHWYATWSVIITRLDLQYSLDTFNPRTQCGLFSEGIRTKQMAIIDSVYEESGASLDKQNGSRTVLHNNVSATASQSYQASPEDCGDEAECVRFLMMLQTWPSCKPRASFYYLISSKRLDLLRKSLESLDKYFNNEYKYPVILFHEADSVSHIPDIRTWTQSEVYFQQITLSPPGDSRRNAKPKTCKRFGASYKHMCRFQSKLVYHNILMQSLDWAWRLDDDSYFLAPITYDPVKYMEDNGIYYGYVWAYLSEACHDGLWKLTRHFLSTHDLTPCFTHRWQEQRIFYNNFEISSMSLWRSPLYQAYIEVVDRSGGIYAHRWGDAPIKTLGVTMMLPATKIHRFWDIAYQHQTYSPNVFLKLLSITT